MLGAMDLRACPSLWGGPCITDDYEVYREDASILVPIVDVI